MSVLTLLSGWSAVRSLGLLTVAGLIAGLAIYFVTTPNVLKDSRRRFLPPGPKGLPLIGNLLDLADSDLVRDKVRAWAKEYPNIFYTRIGGTDYVWLSSPRAVKDLMDKKSSIYSSRPPLPLAQDVASAGRRQLFMPYSTQWRSLRKLSHALLNTTAATRYQPVQDYESMQMMTEFLESPESFYQHNRRYAASVIMLVTYGYRLESWKHPLMQKIYTVLDNLTEMTAPGAHTVDSFPSLAILPQWLLGNWRSFAQRVFDHDSKVYLDLWNTLKHEVDSGTAMNCFSKDFYLSDPEAQGIDNLLAAYTCGGLVEAGSETTSTTLNNFMLAMTCYPKVLKKAQAEIDRVVGPNRLPDFKDEADLPYVRAIVKEVLRWRPVNKFGMFHATTEDDWYEGYFIPKGTVAVLNWWAIHWDTSIHSDPDSFLPERYLDKPLSAAEYINVKDASERDHFTYGAGRRVCPGVHVAEKSLYINIARVIWGFDIAKRKDSSGAVLEPDMSMVRGFLSVPKPFECSITPRSRDHAAKIKEVFAAVEKEGIKF